MTLLDIFAIYEEARAPMARRRETYFSMAAIAQPASFSQLALTARVIGQRAAEAVD